MSAVAKELYDQAKERANFEEVLPSAGELQEGARSLMGEASQELYWGRLDLAEARLMDAVVAVQQLRRVLAKTLEEPGEGDEPAPAEPPVPTIPPPDYDGDPATDDQGAPDSQGAPDPESDGQGAPED